MLQATNKQTDKQQISQENPSSFFVPRSKVGLLIYAAVGIVDGTKWAKATVLSPDFSPLSYKLSYDDGLKLSSLKKPLLISYQSVFNSEIASTAELAHSVKVLGFIPNHIALFDHLFSGQTPVSNFDPYILFSAKSGVGETGTPWRQNTVMPHPLMSLDQSLSVQLFSAETDSVQSDIESLPKPCIILMATDSGRTGNVKKQRVKVSIQRFKFLRLLGEDDFRPFFQMDDVK